MWEALLTKLGIDTLKAGIKAAGKKISKDEYSTLISEAIRELLKLHPNISAAEAGILAADTLELPSSSEMLTAKRMLFSVKRKSTKKKKTGAGTRRVTRGGARKKAKKKAVSKTVKKKSKKASRKVSRKRSTRRR
ncbi:MAG: hypothetical protein IIA77_00270 [Proteobacteria bacterium]|nr:hypothetical protein [Pseudomonadota bacterium]